RAQTIDNRQQTQRQQTKRPAGSLLSRLSVVWSYPRAGNSAVKLPVIAVSPFWFIATTSPSTRHLPSASYFFVTVPLQVIVSPGQTRVAKRTLNLRRFSRPTKSVTHLLTKPALSMPCENTDGSPAFSANV